MLRGRPPGAAQELPSLAKSENEPSVSSTATAPEPPVSVASDSLKKSMLWFSSICSITISLISRDVSHDTTMPGADLAELDPVGDLDHAVEHAQAGVADVVDGGLRSDADGRGHATGRGRLEVLATDAAVDQDVDLVRAGHATPTSADGRPRSHRPRADNPPPTTAARRSPSGPRADPRTGAARRRRPAAVPPAPPTKPRRGRSHSRSNRCRLSNTSWTI